MVLLQIKDAVCAPCYTALSHKKLGLELWKKILLMPL